MRTIGLVLTLCASSSALAAPGYVANWQQVQSALRTVAGDPGLRATLRKSGGAIILGERLDDRGDQRVDHGHGVIEFGRVWSQNRLLLTGHGLFIERRRPTYDEHDRYREDRPGITSRRAHLGAFGVPILTERVKAEDWGGLSEAGIRTAVDAWKRDPRHPVEPPFAPPKLVEERRPAPIPMPPGH